MAKKTDTFETRLARLEDIVGRLENETGGLEESIKLFEEGVELSRQLSGQLKEVKRRVEILKEDAAGKLEAEAFEEPAGENGEDHAG